MAKIAVGEVSFEKGPKRAWIVYQALAWFSILCAIFLLGLRIKRLLQNTDEAEFSFLVAIKYLLELTGFVGLIGAVSHKRWAPRLIIVTGMWGLVSGWIYLILALDGVSFFFPTLGAHAINVYFVLLVLGASATQIVFMICAYIVLKSREVAASFADDRISSFTICFRSLLAWGMLLMICGLGSKRLAIHVEEGYVPIIIGSYLMTLGFLLLFLWTDSRMTGFY